MRIIKIIFTFKKVFSLFLIFGMLFWSIWMTYGVDKTLEEKKFQKLVNKKFKPIDKEMLMYLKNLNEYKNYCFWKTKIKNYVECVDEIQKRFSLNWPYSTKYDKSCKKSQKEVIEAMNDKNISAKNASFFDNVCKNMYISKLDIYKNTAIDILKQNKYNILKDEQKSYTKQEKTKYDKLIQLIRLNLSYIERMRKKWNSKTT